MAQGEGSLTGAPVLSGQHKEAEVGVSEGSADRRIRILCSVGYYLPGYQAGGPVRTIANMVDHLGEEFDFRIVTKDRDALDTEPYAGVEIDAWNQVGGAQVFYASPAFQTLRGWRKTLAETEYDLIYLNSFFSDRFTILPLLLRRLRLIPSRPTIVAPRGEFSLGALEFKASKKRAFLRLAKATGLYRGLTWQASSDFEKEDIRRAMGTVARSIVVAPNLPPKLKAGVSDEVGLPSRNPGPLRIVFLSRISPKKNLEFALEVLGELEEEVVFDIYGIIDDEEFWQKCYEMIAMLPVSKKVTYHGSIPHEKVKATLKRYDLMFLPTLGENFGHVIFESLSAGTPVVISDQTPWRNLQERGVGWDLPLASKGEFLECIENFQSKSEGEVQAIRENCKRFASSISSNTEIVAANRNLFEDSTEG